MSKKLLYRILLISSIAGWLAVILFRRNLSAEASMLQIIPEGIALTEVMIRKIFENPVIGFLHFEFFDIINVLLVAMLILPSVYYCFNKRKLVGILAATFIIATVILYALSNPAIALYLNLNNPAHLVSIIEQMPQYSMLADTALFLLYGFGLFISIASYKFSIVSKSANVFGIISNSLGLLYFPGLLIIGSIAYLAIVFAAPFTIIWHGKTAFDLYRLRKGLCLKGCNMKPVLVLLLLLESVILFAKRPTPAELEEIYVPEFGYIVSVNHWSKEFNQKGGVVLVWNSDRSQLIQSILIYEVEYDPSIETDVQDVFIKELRYIEEIKQVRITNEKADVYYLSLATFEVHRDE